MKSKNPKKKSRSSTDCEDKLAAYELLLYEEALSLDKKREASYIR